MSICLVTGAAGFVGSHLCEHLLEKGHEVVGVDAFIPYYPRTLKERNLSTFVDHPNFIFHELDLRSDDLHVALEGVNAVFHLAAQAGLLRSWDQFDSYMTCNIQATQRLLEVATSAQVDHFLYASTSSVYGRFATGDETSALAPISPYGITKLAGEQLCRAYAQKDDLAMTVLRLYSVYGPRQRPDMGYNIFIHKMLNDELITIDGDGMDSRTNTFALDCVSGITQAFEQPEKSVNETFNIGGGEEVTVNQVLAVLSDLMGKQPHLAYGPKRPGDQRRTVADTTKAQAVLGYNPATPINIGLRAQLKWQQEEMMVAYR